MMRALWCVQRTGTVSLSSAHVMVGRRMSRNRRGNCVYRAEWPLCSCRRFLWRRSLQSPTSATAWCACGTPDSWMKPLSRCGQSAGTSVQIWRHRRREPHIIASLGMIESFSLKWAVYGFPLPARLRRSGANSLRRITCLSPKCDALPSWRVHALAPCALYYLLELAAPLQVDVFQGALRLSCVAPLRAQ